MARPRPQVATTTAVLILFLVAEVVSSDEASTIVLRPPHGGGNRHTMFLPLFLSPPPSSFSRNSSPSLCRQIQGSDPLHPNARMPIYDDLLLNGLLTLVRGPQKKESAHILDNGNKLIPI
ncbi:uncharacterized protein LOC114284647 [Camellia sinensis]|uniref:uncharacterized protein LOC114284647 n=1 Tax=Camellia sinensis TaxID=4442 RepID=UPI001036ABEE|nr:uncharacterized protein LOC114284647 [Camellia sinensis]